MAFYPGHQYAYGILLFGLGKRVAGCYMVPAVQTATAAAAGGVLGHEYGMPAHGCLPSVVGYDGRGQPLGHKGGGMLADDGQSARLDVGSVGC